MTWLIFLRFETKITIGWPKICKAVLEIRPKKIVALPQFHLSEFFLSNLFPPPDFFSSCFQPKFVRFRSSTGLPLQAKQSCLVLPAYEKLWLEKIIGISGNSWEFPKIRVILKITFENQLTNIYNGLKWPYICVLSESKA